MPNAGLGDTSLAVLRLAAIDAETIARFQAKVRRVEGSGCHWYVGAVSARGHGRFWLDAVDGRDVVMIAHRFAWAVEFGVESLVNTPVLGHRCDNPLCQRIDPKHVVASSALANRREWASRRHTIGSALRDTRGSRGRARVLRDAIRSGSMSSAAVSDLAAVGLRFDAAQLPLWEPAGC
ncbi:MAG: hypothetical protein JWM93_734 [Frankiales bacterium]|nr:hypothetical protein [Frankiales bacterium]